MIGTTTRLVAVFTQVFTALAVTQSLVAQGPPPPPPPPPLQPLQPPVAPAGNPVTPGKVNLGKALFWDEQLSSTRTISCGTCHQPAAGGSDPRSRLGDPVSTHPGPDGVSGNADDITGSPGVPANGADGSYSLDDFFGMARQVTGRYAPSAINAGYAPSLFWDGRADGAFVDPVTGETILATGAALESQAAGPPTSPVEMAHAGRDWAAIAERIAGCRPLAVAANIPSPLSDWIDGRNYPELFGEVFGDADVTASRIIMAIATYERTLVSNGAPIDDLIANGPGALTAQQQRGSNIFNGQGRCNRCHTGNRFTDDRFHYIGVRPQNDDIGREAVTGNANDRGRMKTPTLRNASLKNEFMRNGRFGSLAQVVAFYNRGGDFNAPNKDNDIRPLGLNAGEQADLVAFLQTMTDPRVANETGPFTRPSLFAGGPNQATLEGTPVPGAGGQVPRIIAIEPPLKGNPNFTIGLSDALPGAGATLVIDDAPIGTGAIPAAGDVLFRFDLALDETDGFGSVPLALPGDDFLEGRTLHARWFVHDPSAANGLAESSTAGFMVFGASAGAVPAPSSVRASDGASAGGIDVTWDPVPSALSYQVFRDGSLAGITSTNTFSDTGLSPGESFSYEIVAVTSTEAGPRSAPETGSTADSPVTPPAGLTASDGTTKDAIELTWSTVHDAEGYTVYRGSNGDFSAASVLGTASDNAFTDGSGSPAVIYTYWVTATADGSESAQSPADTGFRGLGSPATFTASSDRSSAIELTWSAVDGATEYLLTRSADDSPTGIGALALGAPSGTAFSDTSAAAGTEFRYWIQARAENGITGSRIGPVLGLRTETPPPPAEPEPDGIAVPGTLSTAPTESDALYDETATGRYWGLLHDASVPESRVALLGYASARISHNRRTGLGAASLTLRYEGQLYRLRGAVDSGGALQTAFIKRDGNRTEMTLSLQLTETGESGKLTGTLTGDGNTTGIELCHREYDARRNPATEIAGRYTLVLPSDSEADHALVPGGDGVGSGVIRTDGTATFGVRLGDGSPATLAMYAGPDDELMFYRTLYRGASRGFIGGKITVRDVPGVSDADGMLQWTRGGNPAAARYPEAFDLQQPAVACRYLRPERGERILAEFSDSVPNAALVLEGGNLDSDEIGETGLDWTSGNRVIHRADTVRIGARANVRTGRVGGRYRDTAERLNLRFYGVAFQKQGLVTGHFLGNGETGYLQIAPVASP